MSPGNAALLCIFLVEVALVGLALHVYGPRIAAWIDRRLKPPD